MYDSWYIFSLRIQSGDPPRPISILSLPLQIFRISELQDYYVIEKIKAIMGTKEVAMTAEQKNAIDEALVSIENNGTKPHDVVMEQTKKKFPHLFQE